MLKDSPVDSLDLFTQKGVSETSPNVPESVMVPRLTSRGFFVGEGAETGVVAGGA